MQAEWGKQPLPATDEMQELVNGQWIPVYRDEDGVYHPVGLQLGQGHAIVRREGR